MSQRNNMSWNSAIQGFQSPVKLKNYLPGKKIQLPYAEWVTDNSSGMEVLHIREFKTLIQAVNKAKYADGCASGDEKEHVTFFRGQARLYGMDFRPSVYRGINEKTSKQKIDQRIDENLNRLSASGGTCIRNLPLPVLEGVFQQYEQSSRWIDAVDNIWIALWFACHDRWEEKGRVTYLRRIPSQERPQYRYAYILLLGIEKGFRDANGYWKDAKSECVDLRYAISSHFVRPHVQHGVLIRALNKDGGVKRDMQSLVRGIIRMDLDDALRWLGDSESLSVQNLFPGPMFDTGFRDLISDGDKVGLAFR